MHCFLIIKEIFMKKLFALLFFALCSTTYAMDLLIQMPNSEILTNRLQNAHFGHFVENTEIIKQLANQEKHLSEVVEAINIAVDAYCQKNTTSSCNSSNACFTAKNNKDYFEGLS